MGLAIWGKWRSRLEINYLTVTRASDCPTVWRQGHLVAGYYLHQNDFLDNWRVTEVTRPKRNSRKFNDHL